eukprot:SAG22_NODE_20312_length_266_cov_1.532934_2_plen_49_part_01
MSAIIAVHCDPQSKQATMIGGEFLAAVRSVKLTPHKSAYRVHKSVTGAP